MVVASGVSQPARSDAAAQRPAVWIAFLFPLLALVILYAHLPSMERPTEFNRIVLDFLADAS